MISNENYLSRGIKELGDLADKMVFVGGIVVDFYTDYKEEIRSTFDIDVVIEATNYIAYHDIEKMFT